MSTVTVFATCQFCRQPIELEINAEYLAGGDQYHLLDMAACNTCSDYREEQLRIARVIKGVSIKLFQKVITDGDAVNRAREVIEKQLKRYMRHVAEHHGLAAPEFSSDWTDHIMGAPQHYSAVLRKIHEFYFSQPQLL